MTTKETVMDVMRSGRWMSAKDITRAAYMKDNTITKAAARAAITRLLEEEQVLSKDTGGTGVLGRPKAYKLVDKKISKLDRIIN